jgi:hypothetical protein
MAIIWYPWKEVGEQLGQGPRKLARIQQNIRESTRAIWSVTVPDRAGSISVDNLKGKAKLPTL